jgi:hypothetical protein
MKISWWQWWPFQKWRIVGKVESADEIPDALPRNSAVLVGSAAAPKWIAFDCPCRTGHRIMLNTDRIRLPHWRVDLSEPSRLTLSPSVDFRGDRRRCHYFVRAGKIVWAGERDR